MDDFEVPPLNVLQDWLSKPDSESDIVRKMRALFYARHHDSADAIQVLQLGLRHPSVLLRHEIAYVMGQMSQPSAQPILIKLLNDKQEHCMVRHEAGEALNALGLTSSEAFAALEANLKDNCIPVAETCELALRGLEKRREKLRDEQSVRYQDPTETSFYIFTQKRLAEKPQRDFGTCDPAEGDKTMSDIQQLKEILMDENGRKLWDRYVALFTLRNMRCVPATEVLADALTEKSSALLRHEICFILGQLQYPISVDRLIERLQDSNEHEMVRHEAALALGSVGADKWTVEGREARKKAIQNLQKFTTDNEKVVAESCLVGLDNIGWETGDLEIDEDYNH